jgi:cytokinin riboside 5'-monophosphate phosphoribohydrolase
MIHSVTVYCSSNAKIGEVFRKSADELGTAIARRGWGLIYGGNRVGMMGILADAARKAGGKVIGITPQRFIDLGVGDDHCDELVVTTDMRDRKQILEFRGDALLALPGGLGTLEEVFEVIVGRQLGYHKKPIVILNIENYYQPLMEMIDHGVEHGFIRAKAEQLFFLADSVAGAMQYLQNVPPDSGPIPI